jgi:hypothetical protein
MTGAFFNANEEIAVNPGDIWHTPGETPHGVRTGERKAIIIDIFSPLRMALYAAWGGTGG